MTGAVETKAPSRPFDPHRRPATPALRDLYHDVSLILKGYEHHFKLRKRKRSASGQKTYENTVEAILCDLIHRELEHAGGRVHVTQSHQVLRKASRYKGKALGKTLPDILKVMSAPEMDFVTLIPGKPGFTGCDEDWTYKVKGKQTVLSAGDALLSRIKRFGITFADIGRSPDEEVILLRGKKQRSDQPGQLIEYTDTAETDVFRQQLTSINTWLEQAEVACDHRGALCLDRRLRRIFNNSDFRQSGRLYGGFWQRMNGEERLNNITLDDDSVVELDYGQMGLLLLYALEGKTPPTGDLYDLTAFGISASCRPGIKKVIQSAINASKPLSRMPKGARKTIPKTFSLSTILTAVRTRHAGVAHRFGSGVGLTLMRLESDILVEVLLSLKSKGITALPIHDAVLVSAANEMEATSIMINVFRSKTGLVPEVTAEHP